MSFHTSWEFVPLYLINACVYYSLGDILIATLISSLMLIYTPWIIDCVGLLDLYEQLWERALWCSWLWKAITKWFIFGSNLKRFHKNKPAFHRNCFIRSDKTFHLLLSSSSLQKFTLVAFIKEVHVNTE